MTSSIRIPTADGQLTSWRPSGMAPLTPASGGFHSRVAYAATHVVFDPLGDATGGTPPIDWEATMAFRRHIWAMGLGVAEAMDTAQRGNGLNWSASKELIKLAVEEAVAADGDLVCGAGTDQLSSDRVHELPEIVAAFREQVEYVENLGGRVILMASRALAARHRPPNDYLDVYERVLAGASRPVMIHWLGEVFDDALSGYWGSADPRDAMTTLVELVKRQGAQIDGIKFSRLDPQLEVALRRRGVRVYTGDDLNFPDLILGDSEGHSDALLGVFDAIAPAAVAALQALDRKDLAVSRSLFESTIPLAHHLFEPPTSQYKSGIVFLAYLNGWQPHFRMLAGAERDRSLPHLARVLVLADQAGLLTDPEMAVHRLDRLLVAAGIN